MGIFAGTPFDRPPHCERCEQPESECRCPPVEPLRTPPEKQIARLRLEKRKGGRLITTILDLRDEGSHLSDLLTELKAACGAGGTLQEGRLELQGDLVERVAALLQKKGYRTR